MIRRIISYLPVRNILDMRPSSTIFFRNTSIFFGTFQYSGRTSDAREAGRHGKQYAWPGAETVRVLLAPRPGTQPGRRLRGSTFTGHRRPLRRLVHQTETSALIKSRFFLGIFTQRDRSRASVLNGSVLELRMLWTYQMDTEIGLLPKWEYP